jgi:hypothetical protein
MTTPEDITWIRANYQIDDMINLDRHRGRSQAMIKQWILNPIYSKWSRYVMREIMRMYQKTLLLYQSSSNILPPVDIPYEMLPVLPRRRMNTLPNDSEFLAQRPTPYADGKYSPLFIISKRQLSIPKTTVGMRIVIIGGGSSTFSILQTLCYVPHLHLMNIYLVMEQIPPPWNTNQQYTSDEINNLNFSCLTGSFSPINDDEILLHELYALGLANRVTLVQGRLHDIDRDNRAIALWDDIAVEYDILILSTGIQGNSIYLL